MWPDWANRYHVGHFWKVSTALLFWPMWFNYRFNGNFHPENIGRLNEADIFGHCFGSFSQQLGDFLLSIWSHWTSHLSVAGLVSLKPEQGQQEPTFSTSMLCFTEIQIRFVYTRYFEQRDIASIGNFKTKIAVLIVWNHRRKINIDQALALCMVRACKPLLGQLPMWLLLPCFKGK